jgi:predicted CoA-substrate-specific enzyme activase
MIFAGCDVGSLTSKAVIIDDSKILATGVIMSSTKPEKSANEVMEKALALAGLSMKDIHYNIGTGYGRKKISFINEEVSELTCHARGSLWLMPSIRTVIDIGGQDCKVIKLDNNGIIVKFITNDKCAAGTGRFLEVMAKVMGISLDELGRPSLESKSPITIASACTVWAQADVIQYLNDKVPLENIITGVNNAMAARIAVLVNNLGLERDIFITGGVAKNYGVVAALERLLGIKTKKMNKFDPQITGALGAAIIAKEKSTKGVQK